MVVITIVNLEPVLSQGQDITLLRETTLELNVPVGDMDRQRLIPPVLVTGNVLLHIIVQLDQRVPHKMPVPLGKRLLPDLMPSAIVHGLIQIRQRLLVRDRATPTTPISEIRQVPLTTGVVEMTVPVMILRPTQLVWRPQQVPTVIVVLMVLLQHKET